MQSLILHHMFFNTFFVSFNFFFCNIFGPMAGYKTRDDHDSIYKSNKRRKELRGENFLKALYISHHCILCSISINTDSKCQRQPNTAVIYLLMQSVHIFQHQKPCIRTITHLKQWKSYMSDHMQPSAHANLTTAGWVECDSSSQDRRTDM